jgi:putative membrane protein
MTTPPDSAPTQATDVSRRTWMAAERTWLAWWRTGLGTTALAIAVGRLLPGLTKHAQWPYRALGIGYGVLAVVLLVLGAFRQQRIAQALRREDYAELSLPLVMWLTAAGVALSTLTLFVIVLAL